MVENKKPIDMTESAPGIETTETEIGASDETPFNYEKMSIEDFSNDQLSKIGKELDPFYIKDKNKTYRIESVGGIGSKKFQASCKDSDGEYTKAEYLNCLKSIKRKHK